MSHASSPPRILVVLDGPAGAGKSTVAREVARRFGLPLLDTGAIYRTLALLAQESGVSWEDETGLVRLAERMPLSFAPGTGGAPRVLLDGRDVSEAIRTPEVSEGASRVSALPRVRAALLDLQRRLARGGGVAEGRDLGTVVFPDADVKFFLTADLSTRARRRRADLARRGRAPTQAEMEAAIARRDARDAGRAVAPLRPAPDAVHIDTSNMSLEDVVDAVSAQIAHKLRGNAPDVEGERAGR